MKFKLIISFLFFLSACLMGCSESAQQTSKPSETIDLPPTAANTTTSIPKPTDTSEPTKSPSPAPTNKPIQPDEVVIKEIPLAGPIANPKAQISGMAWHGDKLLILPQYPEKEPAAGDFPSLFVLEKADILTYLNGSTSGPLTPSRLPFLGGTLRPQIPGYEGYEAIAVDGDHVYLTIEANDFGRMAGYLVEGIYSADQGTLQIDSSTLIELPVPVQIFNYAYESLITTDQKLLTIYEANGAELNPNPIALKADISSQSIEELGFNRIEYRITDATSIDEKGRFWVTNIFIPIEFWLYSESDPIFEKFGKGETHAEFNYVERLLQLQYNGDEITLTDAEPIQLELDDERNARNWEALVALEDMGFLAMTDTYPDTILAFIPLPEH